MIVALLVPPVLVANGLAAGVLLWTAVGGVPLTLRMPPDEYVRVAQFWGKRFEPLQPICIGLTCVADVALAAVAAGPARLLFGLGAAATVSVIAISVTRNVPIKRWVASLDASALPADWERRDPRRRWAAWNLNRTVLAMLALVVNSAAVALLI